jgi:hypothetical protein
MFRHNTRPPQVLPAAFANAWGFKSLIGLPTPGIFKSLPTPIKKQWLIRFKDAFRVINWPGTRSRQRGLWVYKPLPLN